MGIVLMVIGHTSIPHNLLHWIYSFHMPFFFFVSGVTLSTANYRSFSSYLKHKLFSLIFPFLIFSCINIFLIVYAEDNNLLSFTKVVFKDGWSGYALWFIPVLFVVESGFYFFEKIKKQDQKWAIIVLVFTIGWYMSAYHFSLPWSMATIWVGSGFLFSGRMLKSFVFEALSVNKSFILISSGILGLILGVVISYFWHLDLFSNSVQNLPFLLIGAYAGIWFLVIAGDYVTRKSPLGKKVFTYLGKNSFIVLAFSQSLVIVLIKILGKNPLESSIGSSILRHLLLWVFLVLIIELINRYLPWMLGKGFVRKS